MPIDNEKETILKTIEEGFKAQLAQAYKTYSASLTNAGNVESVRSDADDRFKTAIVFAYEVKIRTTSLVNEL